MSLLLAVLLLQTEVGEVAASPDDWPMFHANLQRTGTTSEIVTPPLILKWKYETEGSHFSDPVISGGIVYVSSGDTRVEPYRYALDALDASTGALRWSYTIRPYVYDILPSSPAISDGTVYVSSEGVYAFQGTLPPSTSPSVGFAFVVIGIGVGGAAAGVGVAVAMSRGCEAIAYGGYYYCRKHRVPLWHVEGRLWCPIEQRHVKTE